MKSGFSLVELVVVLAIALLILLAVGFALSDGLGTFNDINSITFSDSYDDAIYVRRYFDAIIRKSSGNPVLNPADKTLKVYFYNDWGSTFLDRYTRFFKFQNQLRAEYGTVDSGGTEQCVGVDTICDNVSSCDFYVSGRSAQMMLELDDGTKNYTVATSAVAHN
jgi:prepilin-type N-terminal cleavage/methylation domain-containing protein